MKPEIFRLKPVNYYLYRIRRLSSSTLGYLNHNRIDAFWELRHSNSGDLITPLLLKHYGFTPVHSYPNEAGLFSCGSILEKIPEDFSGFVLGTGFMYRESQKSLKNARILALRGELTRQKIGAPADVPLGDPGLLVSRLLGKRQKKEFKLGVVPHFKDKRDERVGRFCKRYNHEVLFIDIQRDPLEVLRNIDRCECILSSSLHGLVFADSLGIPNVWVTLSDQVSGKGFKFDDYNSALARQQESIGMAGEEAPSDFMKLASAPSVSVVEHIQDSLEQAFRLLKEEILHS